ncbi:MAG: transcription-repair coupling factor family protein, partial [Chloroflexota bacterium]
MDLAGLLPLLKDISAYRTLRGRVPTGAATENGVAVPDAAKPFVLAGLQHDLPGALLVLTAEVHHARGLHAQIVAWSGHPDRVLLFPGYHGLFYERVAADPSISQQRLTALAALADAGKERPLTMVVADVRSAMQKLPAPENLVGRRFAVRRGEGVGLRRFLERLVSLGYEPVTTVIEPGAFAHRGGIVDLFSPAGDQPLRLEFSGDEVDSIRLFDPLTQRSVGKVDTAVIAPPRELTPLLAQQVAAALSGLDLSALAPEVQERWQGDLEALSRGDISPLSDPYAPFVGTSSLLDYLGERALLAVDDPARLARTAHALADEAETLRAELQARGELPAGLPRPYFPWDEIEDRLTAKRGFSLAGEGEDGEPTEAWPFHPVGSYGGRLKVAMDDCQAWLAEGKRVVVTSHQADRLAELFAEREVFVAPLETLERAPEPGSLALVRGTLLEGWRADGLRLVLL